MEKPIKPLSAKPFRKLLISFLIAQVLTSVLPLAGYWYSLEIHSQNLMYLSLWGLLLLQGLSIFYVKNFLNIKERLKDIYPTLKDSDLKYAPILAFIPIVAIPYFAFLAFAEPSKRKAPIFFVHPGQTFCCLAAISFALASSPLTFLSDPTSLYIEKPIAEMSKITFEEIPTYLAQKKDVRFSDTMMKFAIVSQTVFEKKDRAPASEKRLTNIQYGLDYIDYNNKIVKELDDSRYYIKNLNPLHFVSPLFVVQSGMMILMDEASSIHFREKNVPMMSNLIGMLEKEINKMDPNEAAQFKKRFQEVKAAYLATDTYKMVTAKN